MSHDAGRTCRCRATHAPHPLELERHHVWPLSMGGPDTEDNVEWVCPTTHTNIHELLRHLMRAGRLTWRDVGEMYDVPVSEFAYRIAVEGFRRIQARSVT